MKTNNKNKMFWVFGLLLMLFCVSVIPVNSAELYIDQFTNRAGYVADEKGMTYWTDAYSDDDDKAFSSVGYVDMRLDYIEVEHDFYIILSHSDTITRNITMYIETRSAELDNISIVYDEYSIELNASTKAYFLISPTIDGESIGVAFNDTNNESVANFQVYQVQKIPLGLLPAVERTVEQWIYFAEINVKIWELGYWLLIVGLIGLAFFMLYIIGKKIMDYATKISSARKKITGKFMR